MTESNLTEKITAMRGEPEEQGVNTDALNTVVEHQADKINFSNETEQARKNVLTSIMNNNKVDYRFSEFSQKINQSYDEIVQYAKDAKSKHVESGFIKENVDKMLNELKEAYFDNIDYQLEKIEHDKKLFSENYQPKNPYDNPLVELLKRQDFKANLESLSQTNFDSYLDKLDFNKLSNYEINLLIAKGRNFESPNTNKIYAFKLKNNKLKPYQNTETWKTLISNENQLNILKRQKQQNKINRIQVAAENGRIRSIGFDSQYILNQI
ncbi:hypothetical protein [Lactobacillus helveticus]|uniref:hypothetical protein n=1 Tax=Lactobacillus helveticus TaxID=1587 RepID=UPI0013FDA044|nr:hypothetical protein [Lactobacillus helveticus]NHL84128.1 hypothetical protein [Lactobacillus helveticus]